MDDFASDTDSDYTSYWRDWVSVSFLSISRKTSEEKQQSRHCRSFQSFSLFRTSWEHDLAPHRTE